MYNILTITDRPVIAKGIKSMLEKFSGKEVNVSELTLSDPFIDIRSAVNYDCVIISLIDGDGAVMEMFSDMVAKGPTLLYANFTDYNLVKKMFNAGLLGFLRTERKIEELVVAFNTVIGGGIYLDEDFKRALFGTGRLAPGHYRKKLSKREAQVARMILKGERMCDISKGLKLKPSTVSTFKSNVFAKLGVKNVFELQKVRQYI